MNKKLFAELIEGVKQMEAHAAGENVEGVREVVKVAKAPKPPSDKEDRRASKADDIIGPVREGAKATEVEFRKPA